MTTIPDYLISYEIIKTSGNPLFRIVFTDKETNQRFWDNLSSDEHLVNFLKEKIKQIRFGGLCKISVFINKEGDIVNRTLYKDHISISPELESLIKTYFWNYNFQGVIPENSSKASCDIPNFLEGL